MSYTLSIEDVQVYAHHGVHDQERQLGQPFHIGVRLELGALPTSFEAAVDYEQVLHVVRQAAQQQTTLLEELVKRIADQLQQQFPTIQHLSVTARKTVQGTPIAVTYQR